MTPGSLAPSFTLMDINGESKSLSDYRGKKILLNFWASWCTPCIEEAPDLEKLQATLRDSNFTVIGIAVEDDLESVKAFVTENKLNYPILFDNDGKIRALYKISGFPETYLVDPEGKLKMILDPENNEPVIKLMGPRDWNSESIISQLQ